MRADAPMPQEGRDAGPIGMLGDLLAAAMNPNVGAWTLSPVATEIEAQTVRLIAELLRYPTDAGGLMVSGGNMANMACFWAARIAVGGQGMRASGKSDDGKPLVVLASAETHTWLQKATDLAGMGTDSIRWIDTDAQLRMDPVALAAALDEAEATGQTPMMVVAS